jgi:hypothetical protein
MSAPSNEVVVTVAADVTPPTVSVTAPLPGATVTGPITVSANASDDVGVVGVQFLLDGVPLMSEVMSSPYAILWDTSKTSNGSHTLSARARDAAGNTGVAPGATVNVSNNGPSGLVAAYSFNEGSGSTTYDATGNGNSGTITGATWTNQGKFGNALTFNGTNSLVTIGDSASLHLSTGMTLETWVYPTAPLSVWTDLVYKAVDTYFLFASSDSGVPAGGATFSAFSPIYAPSPLPLNTWTHLAVTYDSTMVRLYVNGVLAGSQAQTAPIAASTNPLTIGGDRTFGQYFTGKIDEIRVYNRALTQSQIQNDMNSPLP